MTPPLERGTVIKPWTVNLQAVVPRCPDDGAPLFSGTWIRMQIPSIKNGQHAVFTFECPLGRERRLPHRVIVSTLGTVVQQVHTEPPLATLKSWKQDRGIAPAPGVSTIMRSSSPPMVIKKAGSL